MAHIRANKRVRVAGKDLGAGLVSLAGKIAEGRGGSMVRFLEKLMNWETREIERAEANKKDDRIEAIRDKAATLRFLAEDVTGVPELLTRLESLFTDVAGDFSGSSYVTCSSVHKAKGLEAERVYVLVETLYPSMPCASCGHFHKPLRPLSQTPRFSQFEVRYAGDHTCWRCGCPEQRQPEGRMREEANIEYVALTRAKKTLVLVGGQCPVDLEPPAPVVKAEAEVTS
jgi:superfamily I DNA/RNA helicase